MSERKVYIIAAKRTPIGSFGGALAGVAAPRLGAIAIRAALDQAALEDGQIDEVLMGSVLQADLGQAPARQASKLAGLSDHTPATTINKVCASGMKAIGLASQSIRLGDAKLVIAGGMENMSRVPYYGSAVRWGLRFGGGQFVDGLQRDGLSDAYTGKMMGNFGELCANEFEITREQQDAFALSSYRRSEEAWQLGKFHAEIAPVEVMHKKETQQVLEDEEFKNLKTEKLSQLRPAFTREGTITAANASKLSDGAAAVILASELAVDEYGLRPLAELVAYADAEHAPEWFTTSPARAAEHALKKAGLDIADIDFVECNEAFAVVALANAQLLNVDLKRMNVYGGAVALGHPLGCSGARIVVTLTQVLRQENGKYGLAMICNGGGGASALIIKNVNYAG